MKLIQLNLSQEKKLITNLIMSNEFCKEIIPLLNINCLASPFSRIVAQWVIEFYEKYECAPEKTIQDLYRDKKSSIINEDDAEMVATFLEHLSQEYEKAIPNNVEYSVQQAINYLKTRSLENLSEQIKQAIQQGDPLAGEQALANYNRVELATGEGVSILHNTNAVVDAFTNDEEFMFKFPGAFGDVAGDFNRGDFFIFLGPAKRGKSHYLWYTAETAMQNGFKVVFFTLEMTEKAMIRRAFKSITGQPKTDCTISIPYFSIAQEDPILYEVLQKEEERKALDPEKIEEQQKKLRRLLRSGDVRIVQLPGYTATVANIEAHLDNMYHYDNYLADVVVVDYADLLAPSKKAGNEYRHKLDDIWKSLRSVAQTRNLLMVTASHANKDTFERDIKEGDASEDIRKINHVTSAVALNQKRDEKEKGIMRISQIALREGKQTFDQAVALQCLDIGKACLDSKLQKDMVKDVKSEEKRGRNR